MKKILIIKTSSIGDVLRTTSIIPGLIEKYCNLQIYWLTSMKSVDVLENNPFLKDIFILEHIDNQIYNIDFDLIISLEEDVKCLNLLSKFKKKSLFGVYRKNGSVTYTARSSYWYDMGLISKFGKTTADLLKKSNLFSYPEILYRMLKLNWKKQKPLLYLKEGIKKHSYKKIEDLDTDKRIIGIVVGAGSRWPLKMLPFDLQIKLIEKIKQEFKDTIEIILITGPSKLELNSTKEIKNKLPFVKTHEIVNLNTLFGIISICDMIITPDTLSMHIAISLNKYIIAYFTVTSAAEIEIYFGKKILTKDEDYYCSYSNDNPPRPNCTDKIDLNEIVRAIKKAEID